MKSLGLLTADFSVYYDLVQALRARNIAFVTLQAGAAIPDHVGVVVTTREEAQGLSGRPFAVVPFSDVDETIAEATRLLLDPGPFRMCIIGIDPGERPGVAVLADGRVLRLVHVRSPEAVHEVVRSALSTIPAARFVLRVGNGAPTFRDRILATLGGFDAALELVDETRSTPADYHGPAERDTGAATNIALTPGVPLALSDLRPARPTVGELRDIQRKSRVHSQGALTITRSLARNVALGHITLDQAVDQMRPKA